MKNDRITVALLWSKYDGGVTSVNDLVLGLDKECFDIIFIYLSNHNAENNLIEEAGYKVFYLSNIELLKAFRFSILSKLARILKRHNVDIIHCHAHKPTVYGTIAAMFAGTPVVMAHVHGTDRTAKLRRKLTNFVLFRKINRLLPVAQAVKEDVLKSNWSIHPEKLSVLENSIDYKHFADVSITQKDAKEMLGLPLDAFVFGTVARLVPNKGQIYLIKAFKKVRQVLPSAHVILVGNGRLRNELENEVKKTGLSDSFHFLGLRDDIFQIYKAMDVFVLPSLAEGMPRVLLEAMAAGIPCIGSNVGGIPEVLCDREFGYVIEPRDPTALSEAMLRIAQKPLEERKVLTEKASDRVRQCYSHDTARAKLIKLYESEYVASKAEIQEV